MSDTQQEGKKILIVEDDQFLGGLVAKRFVAGGFQIITAGSGEEALEILETQKPDVLLLDILLPGKKMGFDVLEYVRSTEGLKTVPVIMFSNLGQPEDVEKCIKLGANKFLVKASVVPDEIVGEILDVLAAK